MEAAPPPLVVGRCGVAGGRLTARARFMSPVWGVRFSESSPGKIELRGVIRGRAGLGSPRLSCLGLGSLGLGGLGLGDLGLSLGLGGLGLRSSGLRIVWLGGWGVGVLAAIGGSGDGDGGGGGDEGGGSSAVSSGYPSGNSAGNSDGKSTGREGVASIPGGGVLLRPIGGVVELVVVVVEGEVVVVVIVGVSKNVVAKPSRCARDFGGSMCYPAQRRIHPREKKKEYKATPKRAHQTPATAQEMDDDFDGAEVRAEDPAAKPADAQSKRKRKREKEKANKQANPPKKTKPGKDEDDDDDEDGGVKLSKAVTQKDDGSVNEKFAKMAPSMMADYVGQKLKFWERTLSSVELEDRYIPGWFDVDSAEPIGPTVYNGLLISPPLQSEFSRTQRPGTSSGSSPTCQTTWRNAAVSKAGPNSVSTTHPKSRAPPIPSSSPWPHCVRRMLPPQCGNTSPRTPW